MPAARREVSAYLQCAGQVVRQREYLAAQSRTFGATLLP
jgi:hypothetical protein